MKITSKYALLNALLQASKPSEVRTILRSLGDSADLRVNETFGELGLHWHFYGDRESNISTINLGSKPERSLIERITNAFDAVLEKEMLRRGGPEPSSPMEAAKKWFGRPPSDVESGLFSWNNFQTYGYDRLVHVVLSEGDEESEPTVDVLDNGIGIHPADFPNSILSLHEGNKIKKHYQAGAFGQGGSATLAFSDYVLIVSRHITRTEIVAFTVAKLMNLGEDYTEDAYVYLAITNEDGSIEVPRCGADDSIELYPSIEVNEQLKRFGSGTLVRHFGYRLHGYEGALSPSPGNLYHLLHYMLFDPLLPFRVVDIRSGTTPKDELVTGSRNRLMNLKDIGERDEGGSGSFLRHHGAREMISPLSDDEPSIGVEYWVAFNYRKSGEKVVLRARTNPLYIDHYHPIIGTQKGQNQGELTAKTLRDLQLSLVARHMIIHIDASQASKNLRSNLFSSTREGFREDTALTELIRIVEDRLKNDDELFQIERELADSLLEKETSSVDQEVKTEITRLLRDAGFEVKEPGQGLFGSGNGDIDVLPARTRKRRSHKLEPLPTLPYPQVTRFEIVAPRDTFSIHHGEIRVIRIETDANYRFDREKRIGIRTEPAKLEVASKSHLKGGRMYWRLRPSDDSVQNDTGQIFITLTKLDGTQFGRS